MMIIHRNYGDSIDNSESLETYTQRDSSPILNAKGNTISNLERKNATSLQVLRKNTATRKTKASVV